MIPHLSLAQGNDFLHNNPDLNVSQKYQDPQRGPSPE